MIKHISNLAIDYDDPTHTYSLNNQPYTSITTHIKSFSKPFNKNEIAQQIATANCVPIENVLDDWDYRAEYGSKTHEEIEEYLYTGFKPDIISKEFEYFLDFWKEFEKNFHDWIILPEEVLFNTDMKLAGTADLIAINRNGRAVIIDWKTCIKLRFDSYERMKEPYESMFDCNMSHYKLQLNFYRKMLESQYTYKGGKIVVDLMYVVWLNSETNKDGFKVIKIDDIDVGWAPAVP